MNPGINITVSYPDDRHIQMSCLTPEGKKVSGGRFRKYIANLNGARVKALAAVGIGTEPEYRRYGLVRKMLELSGEIAKNEGYLISILHPFSFAYYRKFGYERVADTRILEFPMSALGYLPRCSDFKRCSSADIPLLDKVYNSFASKRNLAFPRNGNMDYGLSDEKKKTYLSFDENGEPEAYVILNVENYYYVNKMVSVNLNVYELGFTSPGALDKVLGFLRMFEGELETVKIHECGLCPEVERRLRNYHHTKITVIPDIMARINDVEGVLSAVKYPDTPGEFTVSVYEPEGSSYPAEKTTGVWNVKYAGGSATVTRLPDDSPCDLSADIPAFTQMVFGYECYGADTAAFIPGTKLFSSCEDFFRAFPNRPAGVFEHF
ncbi:MAG: GNAT family N-acetyltransferase [Ruminococcaceae bacterium]|nr:GNAT family N-acetyltransferase [Oscillospiraceae bacterium]